jgi:hypothetical protein
MAKINLALVKQRPDLFEYCLIKRINGKEQYQEFNSEAEAKEALLEFVRKAYSKGKIVYKNGKYYRKDNNALVYCKQGAVIHDKLSACIGYSEKKSRLEFILERLEARECFHNQGNY